jgi:hypothetical protein
MGRWPEARTFFPVKRGDVFRRLLTKWAILTSLTALIIVFGPLALGQNVSRSPEDILFPAIILGAIFIVKFFSETRA